MTNLQKHVEQVRSRQQRQWLWKCISWGLVTGGLCGCVVAATAFMSGSQTPWFWLLGAIATPSILSGLYAQAVPRQSQQAATAIDQTYNLKDRISSALGFMQHPEKQTELHQLQLADADEHAQNVDPVKVMPIQAPRSWAWGMAVSAVALLLGFLASPRDTIEAAPVRNDVVMNQAAIAEQSLEELKEFNQEDLDPEIEELLKELAAKIEELKEPGLDPKEALAKLSEMEAALQDQQQQLSDPSTEAALQAIGEALELADPLAAAGQAMANGDMEKAEEELAKAEMPKLDRQTERALTEKLNEAASNSGSGAQRKLKEAAGQISSSLGQGNRSKFKDGMQKLAGECKKQGKRKKLVDLLRKQCQCLSECKCECEGECKKQGASKKKGGKKWGLGASGNDPGDKTSKLSTPREMKIKGQESDSGDVEVETLASEEQEQAAVRQYREQAQKYEQLSESVLDSEPIPLGHRQTIRKYFELIRPTQTEVDAVNQRNEE